MLINLSKMTIKEKIKLLDEEIEYRLSGENEINTKILLREYIAVYTLKKVHDNTGGWWKKLAIKIIGTPIAVVGYFRDIRVNRTAGRKFYGAYADHWGTLSKTLNRVMDAGLSMDGVYYWHYEYGYLNITDMEFARLTCSVLNHFDPKHCKKHTD